MTRLLTFFALVALLAAPAAATPLAQITVTAQGSASTMPDLATVGFTVNTNASAAGAATSENNARYARIEKQLRALGIAESDIQTTGLSLNYNAPPKPPDVPQPGVRYGYFASRGVNVTVHNLQLVGKVIDTAVSAGVTDMNGVTFSTSRPEQLFASALRDGVQRAREHAEAMASAAGLHVVRVKSMQEGVPTLVRPGIEADVYATAKAAPVPTQIAPSPVQTSATVTVIFEAQ